MLSETTNSRALQISGYACTRSQGTEDYELIIMTGG